MVITASLTIPMSGAFTLNLDDPDIPYIEDGTGQQQQGKAQQQQQQQPNAPPRRQRQRSISGSEGEEFVDGCSREVYMVVEYFTSVITL